MSDRVSMDKLLEQYIFIEVMIRLQGSPNASVDIKGHNMMGCSHLTPQLAFSHVIVEDILPLLNLLLFIALRVVPRQVDDASKRSLLMSAETQYVTVILLPELRARS